MSKVEGPLSPGFSLSRPWLCLVFPSCSACVLGQNATLIVAIFSPQWSLLFFFLLCFAAGGSHYCAARWWQWMHLHVPCDSLATCLMPGGCGKTLLCSLGSFLAHLPLKCNLVKGRGQGRWKQGQDSWVSALLLLSNLTLESSLFSVHLSFLIY